VSLSAGRARRDRAGIQLKNRSILPTVWQVPSIFEGAVYHVMLRGNERRIIFRDDGDRTRFRELWIDNIPSVSTLVF
jgi:hypothetical protein